MEKDKQKNNENTNLYAAYASVPYKRKDILRQKTIGQWTVAIVPHGYGRAIKIFNNKTGHEHHCVNILTCSADAKPEIKEFYQRAEDRDFQRVCDLATAWNGATS